MNSKKLEVSFRKTVALVTGIMVLFILGITPAIILAGKPKNHARSKVVTSSAKVRNPKYSFHKKEISEGGSAVGGEDHEEKDEFEAGGEGKPAESTEGREAAGSSPIVEQPSSPLPQPRVEFSCKVDKTAYSKGEAIQATLSLTNKGGSSVSIDFPNPVGLGFSAVVFPAGGSEANPVYRSDEGMVYIQVIHRVVLAPGNSVDRTLDFSLDEPGNYYLIGYSQSSLGRFSSPPIAITVGP